MTPPLVSIVIPCYRQGHFLAGAVEAALGQSYPAVEVVVVNDGSDDSTDSVARGYGDRIKYVSQPNRGLSAARNAGAAAATGRFLLVLDSDDTIQRDAVAWLVEAANGRDDVLCVMGFRHFDDAGLDPVERFPTQHGDPARTLLRTNLGPPHCYLSNREAVLRSGGFDTTLRSCEDWDLWVRLVLAGSRVVPVARVGALYRQHPQSMSRNVARMAETRFEVMTRVRRQAALDPGAVQRLGWDPRHLRQVLRAQITREYLDAGYVLREQGSYAGAFGHFVRSATRGHPTLKALGGICKLLPHRIGRLFTTRR